MAHCPGSRTCALPGATPGAVLVRARGASEAVARGKGAAPGNTGLRAKPQVAVEPFHLFPHLDEQAFRFNNREDATGKTLHDGQRFEIALSQIAGKRLTFTEVTGKVRETTAN